MSLRRFSLFVVVVVMGCKPDLGTPPSLVTEPRIIAVRQEPPEVAPGAKVMAEVFAVAPQGRILPPPDGASWDLCVAPKPPSENNVVSRACVGGSGLQPAGMGPSVSLTMPITACALHGPDTPPTKPGEPPLRPRDADVTGGYYQPVSVRLKASGDQAFGLERLRCNLPGVSVDVAQEFGKRYLANKNPVIASLDLDGVPLVAVTDPAAPPPAAMVQPGRKVTLALVWPDEVRESFPVFDVGRREIVDHLEEMVVSWFITGGVLDRDRTGRGEAEPENTVGNTWTAPTTAGPVHLWVVLRDNRGGTAVAEYRLQIL
jgi:hypothetical protein